MARESAAAAAAAPAAARRRVTFQFEGISEEVLEEEMLEILRYERQSERQV